MKCFTFFATLLIFTSSLFAQEFEKRETNASLYATAGVNYAGFTGWEDPSTAGAGRVAGFNGGLAFWAKLAKKGNINMTIEGSFSQQGLKNTEASDGADNEKMFLNYINVPLIIHYHPIRKSSMYLGVGPQASFLVGGHIKNVDGEKFDLNKDELVKNTWGAIGLVGFHFDNTVNFGIELGYHHGFTKFMNSFPYNRHSVVFARLKFPIDVLGEIASALQ